MRKHVHFFLLALFILLGLAILPVQADAAQKTYTVAAGNTRVYSTSALSTGYGWIYDTDEVTLLEITAKYCKVQYNTSRGTKTGYIYTSAVLTQTSGYVYTARAKITTFRRPGGKSYGSVSKGDQVIALGTKGSYIQLRYPVSNGYKFAFVALSDYNSYIKPAAADAASTLSLSGASTPGSMEQGSGFTCKGIISSNYRISKVTVGIWDANNNEVSVASRTPNAYSYDIKNLDADVHFSYAKPGRNYYKVWATDAKQTKCLLNVSFDVKESSGLVSASEISSWASRKNIGAGSYAYNALLLINSVYAKDSRIKNNWNGLNIFLFEGVGASASTAKRMNALCVVVLNHRIVYLNKYCQTVPDNPFTPSLNDGTDVPTVISGIYDVVSKNHLSSKKSNRYVPFAALNVVSPSVLRFNAKKNYYRSTSSGINVHARAGQRTSSSKNSVGCQIVGDVFSSYPNEYGDFIKAVGVVNQSTRVTKYTYCDNLNIRGKLVVDRTYARSYLQGIGYPDGAINILIGG